MHLPSNIQPRGAVLDPTGQVANAAALVEKRPHVVSIDEAYAEYQAKLKAERERERKRVEQASEIVPQRYALMPGHVLIRARPVETAWDAGGIVEMTQDRIDMMRAHEPWGTILMVGGSIYTDYGQRRDPDPEWLPGRQVMFNPAGATDLNLPIPGEENEELKLLLVGFRAILIVDRGENYNNHDVVIENVSVEMYNTHVEGAHV